MSPARCTGGENHGHGLGACGFLDCSDLQATDPVDAEDDAILGGLVELRGCNWQDIVEKCLLEGGVHLQLHHGRPQLHHRRGHAVLHGEPGSPGPWELGATAPGSKGAVQEGAFPLLQECLLLTYEASDLGDVRIVGIRRNESIPLLHPVCQCRVEDSLQKLLVVVGHILAKARSQAFQEGPTQGHPCFQGLCVTAAGRESTGKLLHFSQVELVQIQVHTLWHLPPLAQLESLRHKHGPPGRAQLHALQGRLLHSHTRHRDTRPALSQFEAIQAELHTTVDGMQIRD
mmetsp:Transcript_28188/g.66238  ORF Transcript_28188/g.66238 Transcript_28188/m.66238 type:complete len:287 (+) Transcript_28188:685-1545(+)